MTHPPDSLFNDRAANYTAFRPDYPRAVFAAMIDGLSPPIDAMDVGCGTGISTRALAALGVRVVGVDPNDEMRSAAEQTSEPDVTYAHGTGEETGRPDASADLVLCAQSFHWFDADAALAEFRRVLRPDGRLALLWNVRDGDDAVAMGYEAICARAQATSRATGRPTPTARSYDAPVIAGFRELSRLHVPNPQHLSRNGLHGRARSASYFPEDGPLHDDLDTLFDTHAVEGQLTIGQNAQLLLLQNL